MGFAYLPLFLLAGILVDWAMFGELERILGIPALYPDANGYRELFFPRIIVTLTALIVVFLGAQDSTSNGALVVIGGIIFFLSTIYGVYRLLSGKGK